MPEIYDCVMLFNELEMLETRFHILEDVVDHFVVCESAETHSGQAKPYYFEAARDRFVRWADKVIYVQVDSLSVHSDNSWLRERYHRSQIARGLVGAKDADWIIVADVDEIPSPSSVRALKTISADGIKLELDFYYYDLNHRVQQGWAIGACRKMYGHDPNKIRTQEGIQSATFRGGWHFSYFGGAKQVVAKVDAFMHHGDPVIRDLPRDTALIAAILSAGIDLYGRDLTIERVPLSDSLPRYILDNLDKYRAMGWVAE